jgi:hypothetical protein
MLGTLIAAGVDTIYSAKSQMEAKQLREATEAFAKKLNVDKIEADIASQPQIDLPAEHQFHPGLYVRRLAMPAGSLIVSKIHNTEHPYVVTEGQCLVWTAETGAVHIMAPHHGITKPGTRRILFILEDCVWTTYHPITAEEFGDVKLIEDRIITKHENPLLSTPEPACLPN